MKKNNVTTIYFLNFLDSKNLTSKVRTAITTFNVDNLDINYYNLFCDYLKKYPDHFSYHNLRLDDYDYNKILCCCHLLGVTSFSRMLSFVVFSVFSGVSVFGGALSTKTETTKE